MSFIEAAFPDHLGFGSVGGPGYQTDIVEVASGHEQRNQRWSKERHSYDLSMSARTQAQRDEINAFFRRVKGRQYGFRFKDWADYTGTDEFLGSGTGAQTAFQLRKAYISGDSVDYRTISKPRGAVVVKVGGVTVSATVNSTTGVVTLAAAAANGAQVRATFEFDVPVRFDTDVLRWSVIDKSGETFMYRVESLSAVEIRAWS